MYVLAPAPAPPAPTALVCAALAGATGTRPELVVWLLLAPVGAPLAVMRQARLPRPRSTLPFAGAALALLGLAALLPSTPGRGPPPCSAPSRWAPVTSYCG
ncbi:hypothetical protein SFUMM280S_05877 [Streptomyces fumanus]